MSKMYVANATRQRVEFFYRLPGQEKRRQQTIQPLSQVLLADDLTASEIDHVRKDHEKYGFINVDEVTQSRHPRGYYGLCYSIDKPVSSARIEALMRGNYVILDQRGKELRQTAAIASNAELTAALSRQSELRDLKVDIEKVEITVQQELKEGDDLSSKDAISEGFQVAPSASPEKRGPGRPRKVA